MADSIQSIDFNKFEAVIFDMDGVLVNSEPFYVKLEQQNFRKLGLNVTHEEHITYQGTATDLMWEKVIKKHGLSKTVEELVEMTNSMVTPYFESLENIDPMPGVKDLIVYLHRNKFRLGLASSSYPEVIEIILQKTNLKKYFSTVVDSQMAGASKPEPDIFLLTATKLGVAPGNCVVIEDSANGIKAAKSAGMFCIAFAGPGTEFQDQSYADLIIKNFNELIRTD
jgi:HAD superfamily hydrolase (TIGR01509 family)